MTSDEQYRHEYAVGYLAGLAQQGMRVTVAVEVYDTTGTSKRGHAATFYAAVEQVRAMLNQETISRTEHEGNRDVGVISQEG